MASPYLLQATDGTDLGANIATVVAFTNVASSGDRRSVTETRYSAGWLAYNSVNRAQYPRTLLNTDTFPTRTGSAISVNSDATFRAALTTAQPGDWIVVDNTVTYTGNYYNAFPVKSGDAAPGGNNVIVVISKALYDGYSGGTFSVCPQKKRITAADLSSLAYFQCTNTLGAFLVQGATSGWRFVGLRFGVSTSVGSVSELVSLGQGDTAIQQSASQCPSNIGLDRCWIDAHPGCETRHAVELHCKNGFVIDCGFGPDIHVTTYSESHAICGYNGPGPYRIVNNGIVGGSQSIFFGGAASICGTPSDIEVRYNLMTRPLSWKGGPYKMKCGFELKKAQFVLVEGNIIENTWAQSQNGDALLLKSESYGDGMPTTADVIVRANYVRNVASALTYAGVANVDAAVPANRVISFGNLYLVGATAVLSSGNNVLGPYYSTNCGNIHDTFHIENNLNTLCQPPQGSAGPVNWVFRDCIIAGTTTYGLKPDNGGVDTVVGLTNPDVTKTAFQGRTSITGTSGNYYPATITVIDFTNFAAKDYSLNGTSQTGGGGAPSVTPAATSLRIVTQPSGGNSGSALTTQPQVEILDQFGNRFSSTATITATSDSGSVSDSGNTKAAVAGLATFTALTGTAGATAATTWTFTSPALTSVTSNSVTITVPVATAVATALRVVTQPAGAISGSAFATQPSVEVIDQYGQRISSTATITALVRSAVTVTTSGTAAKAAVAGLATWTDLGMTISTDGYHAYITFSSPGLTSVDSGAFVCSLVTAPPPAPDPSTPPPTEPPTPPTTSPVPAQLVFTQEPGPAGKLYSKKRWPRQPIVEARNSDDTLMTTFNGALTLYSTSDSVILHGTLTVNAVGGVARWTNVSASGSGPFDLFVTDGPVTETAQ
jgi:hypothetical protein